MGRFSRGGAPEVSVRSDNRGPAIVAVRGNLDWESVEQLNSCLREHQRDHDVILDVWNVSRCEPAALVAILHAATVRTDESGRGFALVGEPCWTCMHAIEANPATQSLLHRSDVDAACVALERAVA
jgi:anti-anti-sigma regulatory factor